MQSTNIAFCLIIAFVLSSLSLKASHYSAGEIFYEWIGDEPGKGVYDYRIYVSIFRVIGPQGPANLTGCVFISGQAYSQNITYNFVSPASPLPQKYRTWWKDLGPHPVDPYGWEMNRPTCIKNSMQISECRYVAEVTLSGRSSNWRFAIDPPCCRDANDNLSQGGDFYLEVKLDNTLGPSSSPRITSPAIGDFCVADTSTSPPIVWSQRASEEDGDSISIDFASVGPLSGNCGTSPNPLPYDSGLSVNKPLPLYGNMSVEKSRGVFRFRPKQQGSYVVKIEAKNFRYDSASQAYRNIGNTVRELVFEVTASCDSTIYNAPGICMVGFDVPSRKMRVYFEGSSFNRSDSIFLFRGNRKLSLLRAHLNDSSYIDTTLSGVNYPPERNAAYALSRCGVYTDTGKTHKNMYLQASVQGNSDIYFNWTPYEGHTVNQYVIYSTDSKFENETALGQVPGNVTNYTATNFSGSRQHFLIEAVLDSSIFLPLNYPYSGPLAAASLNGIALHEFSVESLEIYPNPSKASLHIKWPVDESRAYSIFNASGQKVKDGILEKHSTTTLNIEAFTRGCIL